MMTNYRTAKSFQEIAMSKKKWTPEERADWLRRWRKLVGEVRRESDALAAPRFGMQWSRWQREEQDLEEVSNE